ncbi:leucyl aminopeptidase family protein, partial [bacterium]|nr:leucyl aminopeptidase family protein [bacterium]
SFTDQKEVSPKISLQFVTGLEKPGFGDVSQTLGALFFKASDSDSGVLIVSVGDPKKVNAESLRVAASAGVKWLRENHILSANIILPPNETIPSAASISPIVEGLILGDYRFTNYRTNSDDLPEIVVKLQVASTPELETLLDKAIITSQAVCLARDWAHEPANVINPATLAERTIQIAKQHHLSIKVLDEKDLATLGANALLAVGKGSATPARLIVLEYPGSDPESKQKPIVLVGKAITFDTGGYSIKMVDPIKGMKYDKCGGVDVIATLIAASELHLAQRVVGIIGAAENSISGDSYKPDDILKTLSGKTVEIITTDAEGRLVLADCFAYAQREYFPRVIIDLATLTGAIVLALGSVRAGLFSNDEELADSLLSSGERTHERLGRMPLDEDYLVPIKGEDADLKKAGTKHGSASQAAKVLQQFIDPQVP